jgi:hypothetical protein
MNVGVTVNQAGKDRRPGQINQSRPGGNLRLTRRPYAINAPAADDDDLIVQHFSGTHVEQLAGANILRGGGRRLWCGRYRTRERRLRQTALCAGHKRHSRKQHCD